jgi:hypothetical protein
MPVPHPHSWRVAQNPAPRDPAGRHYRPGSVHYEIVFRNRGENAFGDLKCAKGTSNLQPVRHYINHFLLMPDSASLRSSVAEGGQRQHTSLLQTIGMN